MASFPAMAHRCDEGGLADGGAPFGIDHRRLCLFLQARILFGDKEDEKPEHTSSTLPRTAQALAQSEHGLPTDADLGIARAAAAEALTRGGKDVSVPWENPKTGARGTVTPIALSYTKAGFVCRDFLASFVNAGNEAWLQGGHAASTRANGKCGRSSP